MRTVRFIFVGIASLLIVSGVVWAAPASATFSLYTIHEFVENLIERAIVPEGMAEKARTLARMVSGVDAPREGMPSAPHADVMEVNVSQLISVSDLTFKEGEEVYGVLVLAKNTSGSPVMLEATRRCQIIYRIYAGEVLQYDSATKEACVANEKVTYLLEAGATRMFEVTHPSADHVLPVGTYRMEIEYPGYGKGERIITVTT